MTSTGATDVSPAPQCFVSTRWSVVLRARDKADPGCREALETLCRTYWYPLYAFVRGSGHSPQDAEDLTQEFFALLLAKDFLQLVEQDKGRFRTFLRMAMKRFLANEWDRVRAMKRGSGRVDAVFDTAVAEQRFQQEPAAGEGLEHVYDRRWALTLLEETIARLEQEHRDSGKTSEWTVLHPYLTAEHRGIPYDEIAAGLQMTPGAARVAVHRARKRFRELFREVIADTVSDPGEVEPELHYVIEVLARA